ncbi:MAG: hypothetical protein KC535_03280 [Nanoarchaeota archaeon]|nr:hypothetical protein [Nanoarchaeota archaeon]
MTKEALRVTRKFSKKRGRNRAPRAKTFASLEAAKAWASANDIKDAQVDAKGKKFVVSNA